MKKLVFGLLFLCLFVSRGYAARLWYQPTQDHFIANCPEKIDVMLDMEGQETTAMDLQMEFEGAQLGFLDGQGSLFRSYTMPSLTFSGTRQLVYSLLSTMSRWGVGGSGKVASLMVIPDSGTNTITLSFSLLPGVDDRDSNIIVVSGNSAYDVLTRADSLTLPVYSGFCDQMTLAEMQNQKTALEAAIEQQKNQRIVLLQNNDFDSQYPANDFIDNLSAGVVVWFSAILMGGIVIVVFILAFFSYQKRKYLYQLTTGDVKSIT